MSTKQEVDELIEKAQVIINTVPNDEWMDDELNRAFDLLAEARIALVGIAETGRMTGPWLRKDSSHKYPLKKVTGDLMLGEAGHKFREDLP